MMALFMGNIEIVLDTEMRSILGCVNSNLQKNTGKLERHKMLE